MNEIKLPVEIICSQCKKPQIVHVLPSELNKRSQGAKVQDAFPNLTPAERELWISQTCGQCYSAMFRLIEEEEGEEDDEEQDEEDFEGWLKDEGFETISIDIGSRVICDFCNKEYTKDDGIKGGMLINRHAACPDCAPGLWDGAKRYHEEHFCTDANPDETFYDFVIRIR